MPICSASSTPGGAVREPSSRPSTAGGYGVPAIFPRAEFPALLRLRGEQGAEVLLRSPAVGVIGVPMPSAAAEPDRAGDRGASTES